MNTRLLLVGMVILLWLPALGQAVSPYDAVQQGNALYEQGQYEEAAKQYTDAAQKLPEATEIHFNQGNASYKQHDYTTALEHYNHALRAADPTLESRTKYNLGNVKYQQALQTLNNPQEATTHLRSAMTYYRDSLEGDPQQQDARYNLELAQRLLRQLQQQQQQQQQNQQQDQQDQQDQQRDQQNQEQQPQAQQEQQDQQDQQQDQQDQQQQQAEQPDEQQDGSQEPQDQQAEQSPQDRMSPKDTDAQTQQATVPQGISPEEAKQILEAIRERAREADNLRHQQRRTRMHDARVDRDW